MSILSKITIKRSFFLFALLGLSQTSFCTDDSGLFSDYDFRCKSTRDNKENFGNEKAKRFISPSRPTASSPRVLRPVNSKRSLELEYDNPQDLKAPVAGEPNVSFDFFSAAIEHEHDDSQELKALGKDDLIRSPHSTFKRKRSDLSSSSSRSDSSDEENQPSALATLIGEKEAWEVQILNAALYRPEVTSKEVDLKYFTPQKVNGFRNAGGETPDLRNKLKALKTLHPKPIKDIEAFPRNDEKLYSPAVRILPRDVVAKLRTNAIVFHLPDYATREPIVAESEEERTARKERQRKEFEELEAKSGRISIHLTSEREIALMPWLPYFDYIKMTQKQEVLLRWPDLVGAFLKYVAPHMTYLKCEGYDNYFSLKTLNFERINAKDNKENHIIMEDRKNPYGGDGLIMNWHHATRIDVHSHDIKIDKATEENREGPYILVLIPDFIHKEYDALLHPQNYVAPRKEIDRTAFGDSRGTINQTVQRLYYEKK